MMKVLSLLLAFSFFFYCKRENTDKDQLKSDPRPAIVFLGNSLTAGRGVAEAEAMPALIQKKLDDAGLLYRSVNAGRSGDTTAGGLARLDWYLDDETRMKALVIELGANDAMRGQPVSEIEQNLQQIIQKVRRHDPQIKIFLCQMHTFPNMGREYARDFSRLFARVARKEKVILLPFPLTGVGGVASLNQEDGIHPNAEGMQIFAANIWKGLQGHL
ncbi:MAG: arylesterase [Spirochaetales bacterium]|nr:arylesterase [Spirochaetales bacterium]